MLAALEARLETLRRGVEELRLRAEDEPRHLRPDDDAARHYLLPALVRGLYL